jgi:hypothetical protein
MIKKAMLGLVALLLSAQAAHAGSRLPLPSVRKQIYQKAKSDGVLNGLVRPSMRLDREGNRVKATFYTLERLLPNVKPDRQPIKTGTFKLVQTVEGVIAKPVRKGGEVWQPIYFAHPGAK